MNSLDNSLNISTPVSQVIHYIGGLLFRPFNWNEANDWSSRYRGFNGAGAGIMDDSGRMVYPWSYRPLSTDNYVLIRRNLSALF